MAKMRALSTSFACLLTLLSVLTFASQAQQAPRIGTTLAVTDWGSWNTIRKGVEFRKITMERSESGTVEFKLLRFDSGLIVPRVLYADQFHLKGASAKTFAEKSGAVAAINANYFDEKGRPLAYLKTAEKEVNSNVSKHALYSGIFGVREFVPFVAHRDNFQPNQAREALQSGPLLVHKGAVEILNGPARYARRSVIGLDKEGRILIGVTDAVLSGLSFPELQELFTSSNRRLDATDLLNLDGGGSAQLYVKAGKFEEWLSGTSEVPVAIGFFARPN
jgi:uncharacterized protein YigE (DUF2233 family)